MHEEKDARREERDVRRKRCMNKRMQEGKDGKRNDPCGKGPFRKRCMVGMGKTMPQKDINKYHPSLLIHPYSSLSSNFLAYHHAQNIQMLIPQM
jgi:hypothetical protein